MNTYACTIGMLWTILVAFARVVGKSTDRIDDHGNGFGMSQFEASNTSWRGIDQGAQMKTEYGDYKRHEFKWLFRFAGWLSRLGATDSSTTVGGGVTAGARCLRRTHPFPRYMSGGCLASVIEFARTGNSGVAFRMPSKGWSSTSSLAGSLRL